MLLPIDIAVVPIARVIDGMGSGPKLNNIASACLVTSLHWTRLAALWKHSSLTQQNMFVVSLMHSVADGNQT